jgi:hypothetical protein
MSHEVSAEFDQRRGHDADPESERQTADDPAPEHERAQSRTYSTVSEPPSPPPSAL